jgi:hypothetical protein
MKNGIQPFIPIYQFSLMNGSQETREDAANSIEELINLIDLESFRPYVVKVTGPLIRIVGDRFHEGWNYITKSRNTFETFVPQI